MWRRRGAGIIMCRCYWGRGATRRIGGAEGTDFEDGGEWNGDEMPNAEKLIGDLDKAGPTLYDTSLA